MDFDKAYANRDFIADADSYPPRWAASAAAFRQKLGSRAETGIAYGSAPRQKLDLFRPEGEAKGCVVFVHGGYWLAFDRGDWSHLAAGVLARGWACVMPGYTLAPEARISAMTAEIARACKLAAELVPGPMVVTGHSAGGHLSARMGCADIGLERVARVVPISPLSDLEQIAQTRMQEKLALDAAEIASESPARLALRPGVAAHVWVGGDERPSFLWQARLLSEHWNCGWTVAPHRHHFDVLDPMEDAQSPLVDALIGGL